MGSTAFAERVKQGPVVVFTVMPSQTMSMGRNLILWLLYCIVVSALAAYIAGRALPPGAPYRQVFRFAGATAFIAYSVALWQMSIWYRRAWTTTIKASVDGVIYAVLTAATFGWLWPR
jgi:ABC-type transport system involved in multi-copper enzyme maturation permease subunit